VKSRLDKVLVERGLAASRERAQALILAGRVLVSEQKVDKPGAQVADDAVIRMVGEDLRYVSRGGLKLEHALTTPASGEHSHPREQVCGGPPYSPETPGKTWAIDVKGLDCVDIGASTGGFTDCMLQRGAASVLAVDTGYGQIAHKLRVDPRVSLMERTNARLLEPGELPRFDGRMIHFFAMDVSFISATLVLPAVVAALAPEHEKWRGAAVILVKPQFEAGREYVGKGGIVRDPAGWKLAIERVSEAVREAKGDVVDVIDSPVLGMEGNREFLLRARWG
jgi:23S rRNA (cytidine1920-2'-O)/16S rRNA (cytidine1409-2'-O)-methyltransferase